MVVMSFWLRFNTSENDVRAMRLEAIHFKKSIFCCKIICHFISHVVKVCARVHLWEENERRKFHKRNKLDLEMCYVW